MARNGSGTYSVVNTFVSGNTITAAGHNDNWSDIATEMTNSVAADGQTSMTGALKGYAGTVSAPGYTFASDTNCGFYRIGADNIGAACAGAKVLDISATGLGVTGTLTSSGAITATSTTITAGTTLTAGTIAFSGNGTKTAPSFAFTSDTDTGLYRAGADNPAMSAGDTKIQEWTTTGTTVTGTLTATGALSAASVTGSMVAAQSDQETGTSTTLVVTPGRQHFHQSAAKCWLKCDHNGALASPSYNITSVADTGAGVVTVTIATDFDDADYAVIATVGSAVGVSVSNASTAVGSFVISAFNTGTGAAQDSTLGYYAVAFGDLP
jgi:hypothetical protein